MDMMEVNMDDLDNFFTDDALDAFVEQVTSDLNFDEFDIVEKIDQCECKE